MEYAELMKQNRTIRKFLRKEIPAETMDAILEDLRYVHCGSNRQVLRYMTITEEANKKLVEPAVHYAASLPPEIGTPKEDEVAEAYIAILSPENPSFIRGMDVGIAAQVITASAWEKGIGSCMIANFRPEELNGPLGVPEGMTIALIIALGYPALKSVAEDAKDGLNYYVDADGNYHVPKLSKDALCIKR